MGAIIISVCQRSHQEHRSTLKQVLSLIIQCTSVNPHRLFTKVRCHSIFRWQKYRFLSKPN